jgi:hypothetical protein
MARRPALWGDPVRVVILVPWRTDHDHRERLWRLARSRWEALFPDWPIYEGASPDGPWNRAAAVNDAARQAGAWDVGLVIDADVMLSRSQVVAAVERAASTGKVTWAHRGWAELTRAATEGLLSDPPPDWPELDFAPSAIKKQTAISWSCCMAVPRKVWDALGGMDERFRGWGGEDTAFAAAVQGLHGWERIEGIVWNLWHDPSGRQPRTREYVYNMRLRDRYAYALRRDQKLHDREVPGDEGERLRDLGNIERAETTHSRSPRSVCYCGQCAREMGLPDWSRWWPSLDELVARTMPIPEVALVVHTGGAPETWAQRSAYLRTSLASLNEHLVLPRWERRVIWSDWGDRFRAELEDIAAEHGFYLPQRLTPEHRLGYTASMQAKWRYIGSIVKAPYVLATEDDFTLDRDVDVAAMTAILDARPKVAQVALLRQSISARERQPGTLLGYPCDSFERHDGWMEHRHFFTCNTSVFRRTLAAERPWPTGQHSEAVYGRALFGSGMVSALLGSGEQHITHIGETRAGGPY